MPTVKKSDTVEPQDKNPVQKVRALFKKKKDNKEQVDRKDRSLLWGRIGFGLGLVSVGAWLYPLVGLVIAVAGLVFNILGLQAKRGRWFAVTGLTLSIFFLILAFVYGFYGVLVSMLQGGV
jgi:hypothetical protein